MPEKLAPLELVRIYNMRQFQSNKIYSFDNIGNYSGDVGGDDSIQPADNITEESEKLSHQDSEDSIYYELDDKGQMVRSKPKESGDDSIYYALDDRGEFIRSEPNPNAEGKASFSKDSGNVTLNTAEGSGMLHKVQTTVWMCE